MKQLTHKKDVKANRHLSKDQSFGAASISPVVKIRLPVNDRNTQGMTVHSTQFFGKQSGWRILL